MGKRVLFIMDPITRLDSQWDNSLALLRELTRRGHVGYICDAGDIRFETDGIKVRASAAIPSLKNPYDFTVKPAAILKACHFNLIIVRKEPPFNDQYYHLTLLLDLLAEQIPVSNHPTGIRETNEKLGTLLFPKWIPETLVTSSWEAILEFQKKIKDSVVVKPLDQKGGKGIFLIKRNLRIARRLQRATRNGKKTLLVQRQLKSRIDKRIIILNGQILGAFEKHAPRHDFRTNLSLEGTYHPTSVLAREKKLVREMAPYLTEKGLHLVGIDVMEGKLLDFNVTCPAGLTVLRALHSGLSPVQDWASFLEHLRPEKAS